MRRLLAPLALLLLCASAWADFRFVHMTDTHVTESEAPDANAAKCAEMFREISALEPKPSFVVNTGDVVEVGTPKEYSLYQKVLADLTVKRYDAPGNHDVRWNPLGKEGYTLGTKQPLYQSWDYEGVHFVTLDSTVLLHHLGHFDQHMLDWLATDLKKVGTERPVVIGFHHWIGRDTVMVDNEQALLDLVRPYNIRLWLIGHGHSDIQWNIDGAPAIMAKGLYQGSYNVVEVKDGKLTVFRRSLNANGKPRPLREVLSVPLARQEPPKWRSYIGSGDYVKGPQDNFPGLTDVVLNTKSFEVEVAPAPPEGAKLSYRINAEKFVPFPDGSALARGETAGLLPGEHVVTVQLELPDGRTYRQPLRLTFFARDPRPIWSADLKGAVQSRLAVADGTVYATTMGGDLVALNSRTGRELWRFATGGAAFSSPIVSEETVYFGSADHHVYAVDAKTGKQRWKAKTGGAVFAGAATAKAVVCIGSVDTTIYGLDAKTGKTLWTAKGNGMYQSRAATDGERFYVGGWDQMFRCLDAVSGKELWTQKFGKSFYFSPAIASPTVGGGKVYVSSNDGILHAMDTSSGQEAWSFDGKKVAYSGPLLQDGKLFISLGDEGTVYCFDAANGTKLWESSAGALIYDSSFAFGGGNVFIGAVNGTFNAFRASDGQRLWQYRLGPGHLVASPATDERNVYIASMSGKIYAFPLNP